MKKKNKEEIQSGPSKYTAYKNAQKKIEDKNGKQNLTISFMFYEVMDQSPQRDLKTVHYLDTYRSSAPPGGPSLSFTTRGSWLHLTGE